MSSVVIIGLDGATWSLLDPWIDDGSLPWMASQIREGVRGVLHSTTHPISGPAWLSMTTGRDLGHLGVFDFMRRVPGSYDLKLVPFGALSVPRIWNLVSQGGRSAVVMNVPGTYPPRPLNGVLVSGMLTPSPRSDYTYPPSVKRELDRIVGGYPLDLKTRDYKDDRAYAEAVRIIEEKRAKAAHHLLRHYEWDLFMVVFAGGDRVQHRLWKYLDPHHPLYDAAAARRSGDAIRDYWVHLDRLLGELMMGIPQAATVMVVSDHGFGTQDSVFYINDWLIEHGYLTLRSGAARDRSLAGLAARLRGRRRYPPFRDIVDQVDWSKTRAFCCDHTSIFGHIYLNVVGREAEGAVRQDGDYEEVRSSIVRDLSRIPEKGEGPNRIEVWRREDLYSGPELASAPDILFTIDDYSCVPCSTVGHEPLFLNRSRMPSQTGTHRPDGILVVQGEEVRCGAEIPEANIADVAPTVLHLMEMDVPPGIDGHILAQILVGAG